MGGTRVEVRFVGFATAGLLLVSCLILKAQTPLAGTGPGGDARMLPTDWSVLETPEARSDLPCSVDPVKPAVGFDLRFHSGYEVSVPLKELAGEENQLTMIFRVTPEGRKDHRFYFSQRIHVPAIAEDAPGSAYLEGLFDLGEGRYHVDWLMRDRSDRVCSSYWDLEAELAAKDKSLNVILAPGTAEAAEIEEFKEEPPVDRVRDQPPLKVKVLVHFAPQREHSAAFPPEEIATLVSILRGLDREPRIGRFSASAPAPSMRGSSCRSITSFGRSRPNGGRRRSGSCCPGPDRTALLGWGRWNPREASLSFRTRQPSTTACHAVPSPRGA